MHRPLARLVRHLKGASGHPVRAVDTTIYPVAMVVVIAVVLILLMALAAHS